MSLRARKKIDVPITHGISLDRPLPTLLSQALVAFTVEFDNEFERQMTDSGNAGARLSLVMWSNLLRFLPAGGLSVRDLADQSFAPQERIKFRLGCLERWGFVTLRPDQVKNPPLRLRAHRRTGLDRRDGWGSGRGIRTDWLVQPTPKALEASEIWQPLSGAIEQRWRARFGDGEISGLVESLRACVCQLEVELPHGLPDQWEVVEAGAYPARVAGGTTALPLAALLSQLLLAFTMEFDRESDVSLALSANTLRVLGDKPVRLADISCLTGTSPETASIGWRLKPYVVVGPDPSAMRGQVVRLSPIGLKAAETYRRLTSEIERRWEVRFGRNLIHRLRESLKGLFRGGGGDRPLLSEGLVPPTGAARAGGRVPALGRRDVGTAARQRIRDLVTQTEAFMRDPAGTLPHYPLWDMNRGFGP